MNLIFGKPVPVIVLVAACAAMTGQAAAEFRLLYTFSRITSGTNVDGANPNGHLVLSGGRLYGTAIAGGNWRHGTVFSIACDGQRFTALHQFSALVGPFLSETNSDGAGPMAGLVLRSNVLYGTANNGGTGAVGTVYKLNTDGSEFSTLHPFVYTLANPSGGSFPEDNLLLVGETLYGTAQGGGDYDNGTVYRVNTDGSGYARVYDFCFDRCHHWSLSGLVISDGTLYGCSAGGQGRINCPGTVYEVGTDGSGFAVLHTFTDPVAERPVGRLVLSGSTLYGTTFPDTTANAGTVFKLNTDGTGFEVLYRFSGGSDGGSPGSLLLAEGVLYGTTQSGGHSGKGTIYALNTDGTGFQTLYSFTGGADGAFPQGGLIWSEGKLYGATYSGGASDSGTLFSLSLWPQLTMTALGKDIIMSWPASATGMVLQSTGDLSQSTPWRDVNLQAFPVVENGRYVVTNLNAINSSQQFYRLRR